MAVDLRTIGIRSRRQQERVGGGGGAGTESLLRRTLSGSMPPEGAGMRLNGTETKTRAYRHRWERGYSHSVARAVFEAEITAKDRSFWAFQKPVKQAQPVPKNKAQVRNPIDAFVWPGWSRKASASLRHRTSNWYAALILT